MRNLFYFFFVVLLSTNVYANTNKNTISWEKYIEKKTKNITIPTMEPLYLKQLIDGTLVQNYILLDIREPNEINNENTIPKIDKVTIPRGLLEFKIKKYNKDLYNKKIIILCTSGLRSKLAYITLMEMGYNDILILTGGMKKWEKDCLPTLSVEPNNSLFDNIKKPKIGCGE